MAVKRVARVVDVSKPDEDLDEGPDELAAVAADPAGTVRATLADGSVLVFEALEYRDGRLSGRSSIYGEMAIPVNGIRHLQFGHHDAEKLESAFEDWVVRPGKEPEFGGQ